MNNSLTALREYLFTSSHWYENSVKGIENWVIGPNYIFKTKKQLEEYSDRCYQEEVKNWKVGFSEYCLKNIILTANIDLFEEFLNFDFSPYIDEIHPDWMVKGFDQYYYDHEKIIKKFFEVCHPEMVK